MKIDMHVHTKRHSHCASMEPEEMAKAALENGLDGVVITEHDYLWSMDETTELQQKFPELKILRGAEISTAQGHVLVYGVPSIDNLPKGISMNELVKYVHQCKGFAAVAHPCRYSDEIPDEIFTSGLDGYEKVSLNVLAYMKDVLELIRNKLCIPGIAGTDAHDTESLGVFATDFHQRIMNEQEMIHAVKTSAFSIYRDYDRIKSINADVAERIDQARRLIERGLPSSEIKNIYGFSYSFQYGVKNNKDMRILCDRE